MSEGQDEAKKKAKIEGLVEKLGEVLFERKPDWDFAALVHLVRCGVQSLHDLIEDPNEKDISWEHPVVELRWPVPWDWKKYHEDRLAYAAPDWSELAEILISNGPGERTREFTNRLVEVHIIPNIIRSLTSWMIPNAGDAHFVKKDGKVTVALPASLDETVRSLSPDDRKEFLDALFEPFDLDESPSPLADKILEQVIPDFPKTRRKLLEGIRKQAGNFAEGLGDDDLWLSFYEAYRQDSGEGIVSGPFKFTVKPDKEPSFAITIRMSLQTFVVDEDEKRVYFPVLVGLVAKDGQGQAVNLAERIGDAEDKKRFWRAISKVLKKLNAARMWEVFGESLKAAVEASKPAALSKEDEAHVQTDKWKGLFVTKVGEGPEDEDATETGGELTMAHGLVETGPPKKLLLDKKTRIDRKAALMASITENVNLPRKWSSIPRWDDLVEQEIKRIQDEEGEDAFRSLKHKGNQDARKALLKKLTSRTKEDGVAQELEKVVLTKEAEDGLLARLVGRPFRRVLEGYSRMPREYLIKRVRVPGGGVLEAGLSWFGQAWLLVDEARTKEEKKIRDELEKSKGMLFDMLPPEIRRNLDSRLAFLGNVGRAKDVIKLILHTFGRDGRDPVRIPYSELEILLEVEQDPERVPLIKGAFECLQNLHFTLMNEQGAEGFGNFLAEVNFDVEPGYVHAYLAPSAIGSLRIFEAGHTIRGTKKLVSYDWGKALDKDERKQLEGPGKGYVQISSQAPFWDKAHKFTAPQRRLREWIEDNLTRRKDPACQAYAKSQAKPKDPDAHEPRSYTSRFCPLLPKGREFFGALGRFKHNPESGRTLFGSGSVGTPTSGPNTAGLCAVMGLEIPRGKAWKTRAAAVKTALEAFKTVVVDAMGGVVAAKMDGRWIGLDETHKMDPDELGKKARWFLFLATDWGERMNAKTVAYHKERRERGETPYDIRFTKDRAEHEAAEKELLGERRAKSIGQDEVHEDKGKPPEGRLLREMLKAKRKSSGLSQADVARLFGVSQQTVAYWETGPLPGPDGKVRGKPIPEAYAALVERWVTTGQAPTPDELAAAKLQAAKDRTSPQRRKGQWTYGKRKASKEGENGGKTS